MFTWYNGSLTCLLYSEKPASCTPQNKIFPGFSHFDQHLFLSDLEDVDFNQIVGEDVNESMNNVISVLQSLSDKHAPVKKQSSKKMKQSVKPWLSNASYY